MEWKVSTCGGRLINVVGSVVLFLT